MPLFRRRKKRDESNERVERLRNEHWAALNRHNSRYLTPERELQFAYARKESAKKLPRRV